MAELVNLDYLANVPFDAEALKWYNEIVMQIFNGNSNHKMGQRTKDILDNAYMKMICHFNEIHKQVYRYIECIPGGATMANKRAIIGSIPSHARKDRKDVIIVSSIEHTSIINYIIPTLVEHGYTVALIKCCENGIISKEHLCQLLELYKNRVALVSIMAVNNETGIIQNIDEYVNVVKMANSNILFHSDITQMNNMVINGIEKVDIVTLSGYKLAGPHLGVVLSRHKLNVDYTGTPDTANIHVLANIITRKTHIYDNKFKGEIIELLNKFFNENKIRVIMLSTLNNSLNNVIAFILPGYQGVMVQQILSDDGICIGTGSACQSLKKKGSHVISAMGYINDITFSLFRISWNPSDINLIKTAINKLCSVILKMKILVTVPQKIISDSDLKYIYEPQVKKMDTLHKFLLNQNHLMNTDMGINLELPYLRKVKLNISETYLKGANKSKFVKHLMNDVVNRIPSVWNVKNMSLYLLLELNERKIDIDKEIENVVKITKYIPGIANIVPIFEIENDGKIESLANFLVSLHNNNCKDNKKKSICIKTSITGGKIINYNSQEVNIILGQVLVDRFKVPVDLTKPDLLYKIHICSKFTTISFEKYTGLHGLPLGSEDIVAVILCNKNIVRSLISCIQLSTRGVKIVCYSTVDTKEFDKILKVINPYVLYKHIENINMDEIKENIVMYEMNTNNTLSYINKLKDLGVKSNKYVTMITGHLSFDDILTYLKDLNINYYKPLYDDEIVNIENNNKNKCVISMLSGGIDSPVATDIIYKYCKLHKIPLNLIHFSSNINKIDVVTSIRNKLDPKLDLYVINFSKLQDEITKVCPKNYRTILYKIFMVYITNEIGRKLNADCIVMGNSWGQVASQTATNMYVTDQCSSLPIYNPLLGMSKLNIISKARNIKTYEDSICTGTNDCCIMYLPDYPILKADINIVRKYLDKFNDVMSYISVSKY